MITILHVTGYPTVTRDGRRLTFKTRFDLALLLYLSLSPGAHGRDTLARLLWPAVDRERALNALRSTLSRLRSDYGQYLRIDRATITFIPDDKFMIDDDGYDIIANGLHISDPYEAWLDGVKKRYMPTIPTDLPAWWKRLSVSEASHIANFCRGNIDRLIFRRDNEKKIGAAYHDIGHAFLTTKDPGDKFVLGVAIFFYALISGNNIHQSIGILSAVRASPSPRCALH